jgi:ribosomal protein S27E
VSKRARLDNERVWMNVGCPECGSLAGRPCVGENGADMPVSHYTRKMALDYVNGHARCIHCGESIYAQMFGKEKVWYHNGSQYTWCDRLQSTEAEPIDPGSIPTAPLTITLDEM